MLYDALHLHPWSFFTVDQEGIIYLIEFLEELVTPNVLNPVWLMSLHPAASGKLLGNIVPSRYAIKTAPANMVVSRSNESQRSPGRSLEVYLIGSTESCFWTFFVRNDVWCSKKHYTPEDSHGTWEYTPGRGKSSSKPSFSGSMLIFGGCKNWFLKNNMSLDKVTIQWQVSWTNSFLNLNLELRLWPKWPGQKEPWHLCNTRYIRIYYSSEYVISIHI